MTDVTVNSDVTSGDTGQIVLPGGSYGAGETHNISIGGTASYSSIGKGPPLHPSLVSYGLPFGRSMRLRTFTGNYNVAYPERYNVLQGLYQTMISDNSHRTELWDDQWYYKTIGVGESIIMLAACPEANQFCWVWVANTPSQWNIFWHKSDPNPITLGNGKTMKRRYAVWGITFDFDLWNPENEGGWTGNDFIISWGVP